MAAGPGRVCSSGCTCSPPPCYHRLMAQWGDMSPLLPCFLVGGFGCSTMHMGGWQTGHVPAAWCVSEGAFRRLMGLGVFKRHRALLKRGFGVRQVPWAALLQPLAVGGVQHRGQSCWVVPRDSKGGESMGPEMNGQSAAIRVRHERVFKPRRFPVSTLRLQPKKMASVQGGTQGAAGSWDSSA